MRSVLEVFFEREKRLRQNATRFERRLADDPKGEQVGNAELRIK
ncbi:hypothetical protein SC1083_1937 [Aggregatibacter actinomycetemcomitans serotype e str. SC1083]|uniref:Uncharacterized protein n=1 Tax=Aggregatibacter actinomycetemcomitans serotype e str. SC1083 TaxID=907488 RepID=G4AAR1_AGGAC|nr:hypothetical protein SC1083_1937 [Aggregatibacter actinomycetemcomitans serotype e str. SC1083]